MKTLHCGLIGSHISQSRFSAALEMMCKGAGIDFTFELIDTATRPDFDFVQFVGGLRADGWDGVSVTHPHKQAAADYAGDGMSSDLRGLGASNLLTFGAGTSGFNTDYIGFLSAWQSKLATTQVGTVALAGAGGVARAIAPALVKLGAREIRIFDPSEDQALDLANTIGAIATIVPSKEWSDAIESADGLINATPLGMGYKPGTAFDARLIKSQSWAFDAVYTPTNTEFLMDCSRIGLNILSGFDLFQHMAMCSFQAYTGIKPDPAVTLQQLAALRPN